MNTIEHGTTLTRAFDDQRFSWTRTRRIRRRLVAAEVTLLATLTLVVLGASTAPKVLQTPSLILVAVGLFAFIPTHSLLNLGIRGLFDRRTGSLDEHQRSLRERSASATRWGNATLTLTAWVGGVALVSATGHTVLGLYLGFLLWFASGLLAYWHLAWTLPDEVLETDLVG